MLLFLKIASGIALFIASQGILRSDAAVHRPILTKIVASIAIIGTLALFYDGYLSATSIARNFLAQDKPEIVKGNDPIAEVIANLRKENETPALRKEEAFGPDLWIVGFSMSPNDTFAAVQTYGDENVVSVWNASNGTKLGLDLRADFAFSHLAWGQTDDLLIVAEPATTSGHRVFEHRLSTSDRRLLIDAERSISKILIHDGIVLGVLLTGEIIPTRLVDAVPETVNAYDFWQQYTVDGFGYFLNAPNAPATARDTFDKVAGCANASRKMTYYSPVANQFFVIGSDGCVLIWDIATWTPKRLFDWDVGQPVTAISVSNDNQFIAAGTQSGEIHIFDTQSAKPLRIIYTDLPQITRLVFHPTNGEIYVAADDIDFVHRWSFLAGRKLTPIAVDNRANSSLLQLASNGKSIYVPDYNIKNYQLPTP